MASVSIFAADHGSKNRVLLSFLTLWDYKNRFRNNFRLSLGADWIRRGHE